MNERSRAIAAVREEIEVLRDMIDDALDDGASSEDPRLTNLVEVLTKRRHLLRQLEGGDA